MFAKQAFNYAWSVIEARCADLVFCVGAEGFNVMAEAMEKMLLLSVFPGNSFEDPVIGILLEWEALGIAPPANGKATFVFDASGQYGYLSVNGVGVVIKIEEDGVTVDAMNPENGEVLRSAIALWQDIEADGGLDPIDDLQQLYEKIECEGCGLPTQVDDDGHCNICHLQSER